MATLTGSHNLPARALTGLFCGTTCRIEGPGLLQARGTSQPWLWGPLVLAGRFWEPPALSALW